LAQDHQIFSRWTIKIPRYNSDHQAIVVHLTVDTRRNHRRYKNQHSYPIHDDSSAVIDKLFDHLRGFLMPPSKSDYHDTSWISKETWHLIDQRRILVHKHRYHHHLDDEPVFKRTRSHDNVE
jgi:hypothetical protein